MLQDLLWYRPGITDGQQIFLRVVIFIFLSGLLIWLIQLLLNKVVLKQYTYPDSGKVSNTQKFLLNQLISLSIFFFVFSIYFFFWARYVKTQFFDWSEPMFYISILPQLLVYFFTILLYIFKVIQLKKTIK